MIKNWAFLVMAVAMFTCGCKKSINYDKHISQLDQLHKEVLNSENTYLNEIPHSDLNARLDSLSSVLKFIEDNYGGEMSKQNALLVAEYNDTKDIIKKFKKRAPQIHDEIKRTKSQLSQLSQALKEKASHDRNGKIIDDAYVKREVQTETEAANNLISAISELKDRSSRFIEENEKRLQNVLPYVQSLKQ